MLFSSSNWNCSLDHGWKEHLVYNGKPSTPLFVIKTPEHVLWHGTLEHPYSLRVASDKDPGGLRPTHLLFRRYSVEWNCKCAHSVAYNVCGYQWDCPDSWLYRLVNWTANCIIADHFEMSFDCPVNPRKRFLDMIFKIWHLLQFWRGQFGDEPI